MGHHTCYRLLSGFIQDERGGAIVEYALIIAFVTIMAASALPTIHQAFQTLIRLINAAI